jgi:uncharacterized protein
MLIRRASSPAQSPNFAVAVMAKASQPGRTKTRLVPPLRAEDAAGLNTAFLQDVVANLMLAGRDAPIAPYLAFGPPGSEPFFEAHLPAATGLIEAWLPNFGDCLFHAASTLLSLGYTSVGLINSDSPTLPTAILVEAAEALDRPGDRIVLGPSSDGGYYFLGLKHPHRRLFQDVAWSTASVAAETLERAAELGLETVHLPLWYDVDDATSLNRLAADLWPDDGWPASGPRPHAAPNTAAMLAQVMCRGALDGQALHGARPWACGAAAP